MKTSFLSIRLFLFCLITPLFAQARTSDIGTSINGQTLQNNSTYVHAVSNSEGPKNDTLFLNQEKDTLNLDIYLCIGQSNMAGRGKLNDKYSGKMNNIFLLNSQGEMEPAENPLNKYSTIRKSLKMQGIGPSYSFSIQMMKKTKHAIGLVVNAKGGSSINSWVKESDDKFYNEILKRAKQAKKYGKIKGIIWHQGETDSASPDDYYIKFKKFINDLRKDLNDENIPVVIGEIAWWRVSGTSPAFNNMLNKVAREMPNMYCVSAKGLKPLINEEDPHFSSESQIILGKRYAKKMYKLLKKNSN